MRLKRTGPVSCGDMLEAIRKYLDLSIEQFCFEMNWPNSKYYNYIKNGITDKEGNRKPSSPTVNKVFDGINFGINNYDHWFKEKEKIVKIVDKHLFPSFMSK